MSPCWSSDLRRKFSFVLQPSYQVFEPWFQLELELDVAKKGFPFQGFFWLQVGDM